MSTQAEPGETSGSRGKAVLTPAARRGHAKVDDDGGEHAGRAKRGGGGDAPCRPSQAGPACRGAKLC